MPVKLVLNMQGIAPKQTEDVLFERAVSPSDIQAHNLSHEIQFIGDGMKLGVPLGTPWRMETVAKGDMPKGRKSDSTVEMVLDKVDHRVLCFLVGQTDANRVGAALSPEHASAYEALVRLLEKYEELL